MPVVQDFKLSKITCCPGCQAAPKRARWQGQPTLCHPSSKNVDFSFTYSRAHGHTAQRRLISSSHHQPIIPNLTVLSVLSVLPVLPVPHTCLWAVRQSLVRPGQASIRERRAPVAACTPRHQPRSRSYSIDIPIKICSHFRGWFGDTFSRVQAARAATPLAVREEQRQRSRQVRWGWQQERTRHTCELGVT